MTPAGILTLLDKIEASFRGVDAAARQAVLTTGPALLAGSADLPFILTLGASVLAMPGLAVPDGINKGIYSAFFGALDSYFAANTSALLFSNPGIGTLPATSLDVYASVQNAAARDSFLIGPNTARLSWLSRQSVAAGLLAPANVSAPVTALGTATVGAGAAVTFTPGAAIPAVNTTVPQAQGYTGAKGLTAMIQAAIGGTLTVTATGSGRSAAGVLVAGRTWTAVLDGAAAGATVAFVPTIAGDRIASIQSVTGTGGAGAGAFSLQSVVERVVS